MERGSNEAESTSIENEIDPWRHDRNSLHSTISLSYMAMMADESVQYVKGSRSTQDA